MSKTGLGKYTERSEYYVVGWDWIGNERNRAVEVRLYLGIEGDFYATPEFRYAVTTSSLPEAYRYLEGAKQVQARENFSQAPHYYQAGIFRIQSVGLEEVKVTDALAAAVEKVKNDLTTVEVEALRNYLKSGGTL